MKAALKIVSVSFVVIIVGVALFAASHRISPISWGIWGYVNADSGVAIDRMDTVELAAGELQEGHSAFSHTWEGVEWFFANDENRIVFAKDPERYAPQYGGFCAYAVGKGFTAKANPSFSLIHDGRLYLFADDNVKADFVADIRNDGVSKADREWQARL